MHPLLIVGSQALSTRRGKHHTRPLVKSHCLKMADVNNNTKRRGRPRGSKNKNKGSQQDKDLIITRNYTLESLRDKKKRPLGQENNQVSKKLTSPSDNPSKKFPSSPSSPGRNFREMSLRMFLRRVQHHQPAHPHPYLILRPILRLLVLSRPRGERVRARHPGSLTHKVPRFHKMLVLSFSMLVLSFSSW